MSLLLKALQQADRGSSLALEPMQERPTGSIDVPPPSAQAAATLMFEKQASSEKRRMLILLGALVTVVLGMGVYFYLAVFMPWVFLPKPPVAIAPVAVVQTPSPPVPAAVVLAPAVAPVPAISPAPPVPISPQPEVLPRRAAPNIEQSAPRIRRLETALPLLPPSKPIVETPTNDRSIQITSGSAAPSAAARTESAGGVQVAYQLLQEGRLEDARRVYENLRALEPSNPDVLLGLGLIAQRQGRADDAVRAYLKALDLDPKNAFAQASLSSIIARADPAGAQAKLKALIAQQPAAFLFFGLGNVYAGQGRWNDAQSAYFEAQRLEPESPDYAFNLAISLERINQPRAALDYYQRALKLAQAKPAAFDSALLKARIQQLSGVK